MWEQVTVGDFGIGYQAMVSAVDVYNENLGTGNFTGLLGLACEFRPPIHDADTSARELDYHKDDPRNDWLVTRWRDVSRQPVWSWIVCSDEPLLFAVARTARRCADVLDLWHWRGGPQLLSSTMFPSLLANRAAAHAWSNRLPSLACSTGRHKDYGL